MADQPSHTSEPQYPECVYVVFCDVPYEFGVILEVCATQELADKALIKHSASYPDKYYNLSIQRWEVEHK